MQWDFPDCHSTPFSYMHQFCVSVNILLYSRIFAFVTKSEIVKMMLTIENESIKRD